MLGNQEKQETVETDPLGIQKTEASDTDLRIITGTTELSKEADSGDIRLLVLEVNVAFHEIRFKLPCLHTCEKDQKITL